MTSITVIGKMVHAGFEKDTFELTKGIDILRKIMFRILFPVKELREWCMTVDKEMEEIGRYGSSVTDRTHFAYTLSSGCDYYVTSKGETRTLIAPKGTNATTIVPTLDELLVELKLR